jgi:hypothetical protein
MNQYEKRKAKSVDTLVKEATTVAPVTQPVYDQMAMDIYTDDGGRSYKVAEISYNPVTKQAEVKELFSITRLVALQYANTKTALGTLKKKAIKLKE